MASVSGTSAILNSLPDELFLAIGTFLPHPPDALHFTRVCRCLYRLTIPLLYENITLDYELYGNSPHSTLDERVSGRAQPYLAIRRLSQLLEDDSDSGRLKIGSVTHTLTLRVPSNIDLPNHGVTLLIPHMTSLAELRFEALDRDVSVMIWPDCKCVDGESPTCAPETGKPHVRHSRWLNVNVFKDLGTTQATLKTLTIYTELFNSLWVLPMPMEDLSRMEALEYLDIQCGTYLFGPRVQDRGARNLVQPLPPNLRFLQLRCYSWKLERRDTDVEAPPARLFFREALQSLRFLQKYLETPGRVQPKLGKVVIWLPRAQGRGWDNNMRKLTSPLERITAIALLQGITVITKDTGNAQVGISEHQE